MKVKSTLESVWKIKLMVNTFITRYPLPDAVRDLDRQRLGKQRVEAQQILTSLLSAHAIATLFGLPQCPSLGEHPGPAGDILREEWYTTVYDYYKTVVVPSQGYIYHDTEEGYSPVATRTHTKPVRFGYVYNAVTLMWVGYEDGLRYYINLCILEWVHRGYKNNMRFHVLLMEGDDDIPDLPWWVRAPSFHHSQRSALLRKEKVRKELPWYWNLPHIVEGTAETKWYHSGYLWTTHLTLEQRLRVQAGEMLPELCDKITNDFPQ